MQRRKVLLEIKLRKIEIYVEMEIFGGSGPSRDWDRRMKQASIALEHRVWLFFSPLFSELHQKPLVQPWSATGRSEPSFPSFHQYLGGFLPRTLLDGGHTRIVV